MNGERRPLNQERSTALKSLSEIEDFLHAREFNPEEEFFSFEIDPDYEPITAESIRSLLTLSCEIVMTESGGKIIIETGTDHRFAGGIGFHDRRDKSKLSLHTHRVSKDQISVTAPSFADVYITDFAKSSTPLLLAHEKGLMQYRKPAFNPMTQQPFHGDSADLICEYGDRYAIDAFSFGNQKGMRRFIDLTEEEQIAFEQRFAEETQMIVQEAAWDDEEGLAKILKIINLQSENDNA